MPSATLTIVGRGSPDWLRDSVARQDGATLLEGVDDLEPLYRSARCVAVPVRAGGGTKLKAYEAMAYGVPIACTPETVRGIDIRHGEAVIAESTEDIIAAVVTFLDSPVLAAESGKAARRAFADRLSWAASASSLDNALDTALAVTQR